MKQFTIFSKNIKNSKIVLKDSDFHYLIKVRRHRIGDKINLIDENNNKFISSLSVISAESCCLTILNKIENCSAVEINLIQCLPKAKKMDKIIREVVEAGITNIIPVLSNHSIPDIDDKNVNSKCERWNKIAQEAVQQSGSENSAKVFQIQSLKKFIENFEDDSVKIFFHHIKIEGQPTLHSVIKNCDKKIYYIIGPEGGLSDSEVNFLVEKNFIPIYLGKNILRTETAPIFVAGAIKIIQLECIKENF